MKKNTNNKIIQILLLQIFLSWENLTGLHKPVKLVQIRPRAVSPYNVTTKCMTDKIFLYNEKVTFITTALKSVLKLVRLRSLVAKCRKMWKIDTVCREKMSIYKILHPNGAMLLTSARMLFNAVVIN